MLSCDGLAGLHMLVPFCHPHNLFFLWSVYCSGL
jgi:hypothetical protein